MSEQEGGAVPAAQKGSWTSFLKSLASFSGDMSSMTAPSFILSPVSLVEFSAYWGEPSDELAAISSGATPEERMLRVLRWFIMTLKGSYTRRETTTGSEKKPLNPILGEQFFGHFDSPTSGTLHLTAEQVSHHPPVTAFRLANKEKNVILDGHFAQKTTFSGKSIMVKQVGHAIVKVQTPEGTEESYLITLPKLRIDGLFFGSPYIELVENSYIQSSSGWHANITYKGKGYLSGAAHRFLANVSLHPSSPPAHIVEGSWIGQSKYTKSSIRSNDGAIFADASRDDDTPKKEVQVAPLAQQGELESRRVWQDVADGIRKGDFEQAGTAKSKLENEQRAKRKAEKEQGTTYQLRSFEPVADDPEYRRLAQMFAYQPASEEGYLFKGSA